MYKYREVKKSQLTSVDMLEGEPIEWKVERILESKEPIKDGAPEIFTERKEGVIDAYNIRTDRWEIASEAMDVVSKTIAAKRDGGGVVKKDTKETKVVKLETKGDSGAKSISGTE